MTPMSLGNPVAIPNLKVVTLNFWGIRFISKHVGIRLNHLIEALNFNNYDIVALQEIWSYSDYIKIKESICSLYPHSHYFQSGLVGSGCCIFSRHVIQDVFSHKFSLNGYPYKIHHSDWFAGKLVGLAVVRYHNILINVYVTHLHANYSLDFQLNQHADEYLAHRISQLFELGQFITQTSKNSDICLLLGDLNTCDNETGYKMLRNHAQLLDAYKEGSSVYINDTAKKHCNGSTCHALDNIYSRNSSAIKNAFPDGIRIDYILYKNKKELDVKCKECRTCLGKIESTNLNYSDHEGVLAEFEIKTNITGDIQERTSIKDELKSDLNYYVDSKAIILKSINSISSWQILFTIIGIIAFILIFILNTKNQYLVLFKNFTLTVIIVYSFLYVVFIKAIEKKLLNSTVDALDVVINSFLTKHENNFIDFEPKN